MKKKVLLSSILVIALCVSVIAGSTLALFTDDTAFDISVTSGDVEIFATADVSAVYSAKAIKEAYTGDSTDLFRDENGAFYIHEKQADKKTFINGGVADVVNGVVTIERITPGDKVDVEISVDNRSDVAISYRYVLTANGTNLANGMVVTTFDKDGNTTSTEALAIWVSDWYSAKAPNGVAEEIPVRTISIELPVDAGNEYQTEYNDPTTDDDDVIQSVEYTLTVEAVQGNANTTNEEKIVVYSQEPVQNVPPVLSDYFDPETNSVYVHDLYLQGDANITVDQNYPLTLENVTTDVNGSAIIIDEYAPALLIMNCEFNLDAGEYIIDASAFEGGIGQVFLVNVTVNGVLLDLGVNTAQAGQYLNNVYWYQVADPNLFS